MAETLQVIIEGRDGVSRVLKQVSQSADAAGKQVEQAGERGERGFRRLGDGAERAKVNINDLGAAATALGGFLAYAGDSALKQQQTIIGLQAAYGDAADEYIAFADTIAANSIFNDDDIMRGQRYFATLKNNYDLTDQQIRQLMETTADLASAYGVSFEDASSRITSAIRGEGEAAEYLGLTMNQQSIDRENLTLTMSNQEAAQFRLNALYQQTGVYQGTAQKLAESEVGTRAKLTNAIQDNAQALGSFIGPLGTMIAGLGIGVSGLGQMTGALTKLAPAVTTIGSGLGVIAKSPAFRILAGIGIGLAAWDKVSDLMSRSEREQDRLNDSAAALTETLDEMRTVMGDIAASTRFEGVINEWGQTMDAFTAHWQKGIDMVNDVEGPHGWLWDEAIAQAAKNNSDNIVAEAMNIAQALELTDKETTGINEALNDLGPLFADTTVNQRELQQATKALFDEFARTGDAAALQTGLENLSTNADQFRDKANALTETLNNLNTELDYLRIRGDIGLADDVARLGALQTGLEGLKVEASLSQGELNAYTEAWEAFNSAVRDGEHDSSGMTDALSELQYKLASGQIDAEEFARQFIELTLNLDDYSTAADKAAEATAQYAAGLALAEGAAERFSATQDRLTAFMDTANKATDAGKQSILDRNDAVIAAGELYTEYIEKQQEYIEQLRELAGMGDPLSLMAMSSDMAGVANAARDAADSLETVFRVTVGNTSAIGQQTESIAKWADTLIGAPGVWAEIDDLMAAGLVTQQQWNDAQAAQVEIAQSNADVQNYIRQIQVNQAPLIADQTEALENQMEVIARMPADQQLIALGWMDATQAGKAFEFQQLAIKAASGEMGTAGAEAFENYITGAAAADPVLKAMLVDMGLIKEASDGTLTLNTDGLDDAQSELAQVRDVLIDLVDLLDNGFRDKSYSLDIEGTEDVREAKAAIDDLPNRKDVTVSVTLTEGGPDVGGFFSGILERNGIGGGSGLSIPADLELSDGAISGLQGALDATPLSAKVELDTTGLSAGGMLSGVAGGAMQELRNGLGWKVAVDADTSEAEAKIAGLQGVVEATDVTITVSTPGALESVIALGMVQVAADAVPDEAHVDVAALYWDTVVGDLGRVATAANAVPADVSVSVSTFGAVEAIGLLNGVWAAANAIPSDVSTTITTNLVTNVVTNRVPGQLHGGIPGYAQGGIVAELAEANPEILHLATGGAVPIYARGLYNVPRGAYVEPANSVGRIGRGDINLGGIHVHGNVFGMTDLTEQVSRELVPVIADVFNERMRGMGVS